MTFMQQENTYELVSALFIKLLAVVYFIAFASLSGQIVALAGQDGILPLTELLGQVENARHYAKLTLKYAESEGVADFALGYAYEALARVEAAAGDKEQMEAYLAKANQVAAGMTDLESKEMLLSDLETIR